MKKCKYCEHINDDLDSYCTACGGNLFIYVCANCGNEFDNGMHCPRCGVKVGQREKFCPQCGNRYFTNACPNCGFSEINRGSVNQNYYSSPTYVYVEPQYTPPVSGTPKKKTSCAAAVHLFRYIWCTQIL